jgi:UDP-GlcNAc:undecaprenyl-phosphate GlcNAc-1-phosphate transferase
MFLGCSVAIAIVYFSQSGRDIINPATALWHIAIPMMDMVSTMLRRMQKGQSPLHADRTHLHHILLHGGLSERAALLCVPAICAILGIFLERV